MKIARSTGRYKFVTEEKAGGATYTPARLADFVARQMVAAADLSAGRGLLRILDPAVGNGELLLSLMRRLAPRTSTPIAVYGFDTDQAAIDGAKVRILGAFPDAVVHLERGDFLEYVRRQPTRFTPRQADQFDLIIANPPYVRTQVMGAQQTQKLSQSFGLAGRVDLYHAFLIGIAEVLRPGGTAGIIVSNRFMTTRGGASVRQALLERFELRHIWDLGDTKLFAAAVLPAVILALGRNGCRSDAPAFTSIYETGDRATSRADDPIAALALDGTVRSASDGRTFRVQQGVLTPSAPGGVWAVSNPGKDTWLGTVVAHSWGTFRTIGKVRVGVKTCADPIFIRGDWQSLPHEMRPEPALLHPATTHHIARRFKPLTADRPRFILYPHETVHGRRRAIALASYPGARAYFESHRDAMRRRTYVTGSGRQWYEIWVPQDPDAWRAPKLVFRDIAKQPTFWLDLDGTIVNGDCYWLASEHSGQEDLLWLAAAVANSTFIEAFYDHRFNNKLYAGRRRFITQYVEQFPLPDPASANGREIIALAQRIYIDPTTPDATALAADLGGKIWRAFGLGVEEAGDLCNTLM